MPQISRVQLSKEIQGEIFTTLLTSFVQVTDGRTMEKFLDNLLTPTEKVMLAKRLMVAILLQRGHPEGLISTMLKLSRTTVHTVKKEVARHGEGYRAIFAFVDKNSKVKSSSFARLIEKLEAGLEVFTTLPIKGSKSSMRRWRRGR
ncbi:MAG: hypothetical protein HYW88_02175 [Candidatus Sungbacteria bacterium]|nr:hypothetical protein [Candidatus Sungbacteria bacterium]